MGQGPIGLAATMICRFFGAGVVAADTNDYRLSLSRKCGATETVNVATDDLHARLRDIVGTEGVDAAIDCAGAQVSRVSCLEAVRRGGRVALVGLGEGLLLDTPTFRQHFFLKDLDLVASWYSNPSDMFELESMIRRGLNPERMITRESGYGEAQAAYDAMFGGTSGKVILNPAL
jgi:threonine 3-dehydrogenase